MTDTPAEIRDLLLALKRLRLELERLQAERETDRD